MRKSKRDARVRTRTATAWAMSALLAIQLAGTALPTAIAQEVGGDPVPNEMTEEPDALAQKGSPQKGQGTSPQAGAPDGTAPSGQGTPSQTEEQPASEEDAPLAGQSSNDDAPLAGQSSNDDAPLAAQSDHDAVSYVDESGQPATRGEYVLVAEPAGDEPLTLKNGGWYVVQGEVSVSKRIEVQGHAHLILCDGARLDAQKGVHNAEGKTLSVYGQEQHTGELQAVRSIEDRNAGIGGNEGEKAGTFNAYGARTITQGGYSAAGIGGGYKNDGGTVLVRGEKTVVTASGGAYGAGIGGGNGGGTSDSPGTGYTGTVTIEGGTVTAQGGSCGAGIGGGNGYGADSGGGTVTIKGGTVNATGGDGGAGIGGANGYLEKGVGRTTGAVVLIEDGTVNATGGTDGPGIGTGSLNASGGSLTVTGGNVTATGGTCGSGIGGGSVNRSNGEEDGDYPVTITGGDVTATGQSSAAGIGGGLNGDGVTVKIGGTAYVEATGGNGGAGIGSGDGGLDPGSFEASGGTVIAKSGPNAAGIGTGKTAYGRCLAEPKITITGGDIQAYGDEYGAGIGGGEYASGGAITITGGKVLADGRDRNQQSSGPSTGGAGIGAGGGLSSGDSPNNGGTVTIGGTAEVEAIGGKWCAGIGGALRGDGAKVTIGGGAAVTATGGEGGAGIGGGYRTDGFGGAGRTVTIDGGTVTVQAGAPINGSPAEAIGHGSGWDASGDLTIYDAAKVRYSSEAEGAGAVISTADQRVPSCRDLWAQIGPCEHKDAGGASTDTFKPTANKLHHVKGCTQCLYVQSDQSGKPIEYDHEFEAGGLCACGVRAHKVFFDKNANRATGSMAAPYVVEQTTCELPACGFERDGYAFVGWNTKPGGGGTVYADRATLTMGEADVTLFAQWKPARFGNVSGVAASYVYNGKAHEPKPRVTGPEGQALSEGTDYRLQYEDNVNATAGGKKAKVRVVGIGEYADAEPAVVEFGIEKSTPAPPAPPRAVRVTIDSITVAGEAGCEYSADGGRTWRAPDARGEVTFDDLEPGTAHDVVGRVRATANTNASAPSAPLRASTARLEASASYRTHLKNLGWVPEARDGVASGTVGESRRMEALSLGVQANVSGGVSYRVHAKNIGWLDWKRDGEVCGTTGQSRRIEAVQIQLDGELAQAYSVCYRVHVRDLGWMAWACDGDPAGTVGESRRIEAIQVVLVERGSAVPAADYMGVTQTFPLAFRQNGPSAG